MNFEQQKPENRLKNLADRVCLHCHRAVIGFGYTDRLHGSMLRVLVVEDEKKMAELLERALAEQSCSVRIAHNGNDGFQLALDFPFDVIVLDVMLPGMDGFEVARELRRAKVSSPILFLTARDAEADIVCGLELGGDDYLTKPFSFVELVARLRALARRPPEMAPLKLEVGDLVMDPVTHSVNRAGAPVELSRTEYLLLEFLMKNTDRVVKRQALVQAVWGSITTIENNTLDAFIRLLRKKVDHGHPEKLLHTVRGFGYLLGCN
jgi:DNA-binding response OmpR family regulator